MPPDNANPTLQVQLTAAVLPAGELEFAGHARHVAADVAAEVGEYVPASQGVHTVLEGLILYFPAPQASHVPPEHGVSVRSTSGLPMYILVSVMSGT
jgi:hypothetical protein